MMGGFNGFGFGGGCCNNTYHGDHGSNCGCESKGCGGGFGGGGGFNCMWLIMLMCCGGCDMNCCDLIFFMILMNCLCGNKGKECC